MNIEHLLNASNKVNDSNKLRKESLKELERFLVEEIGVGKVLELDDFPIETESQGGDLAYCARIRVSKPFDYEPDFYSIEFQFEGEDPKNSYQWRPLAAYEWDLTNLIDAVYDASVIPERIDEEEIDI